MSGDNQDGGRSLGGESSEPLPASWAQPRPSAPRVGRIGAWSSSSPSTGRMHTLSDLGSGTPPASSKRSSDDDDDPDSREGASWFAGGERSGLSIENPNRARGVPGGNIVRDLLRRAAEAGPAPGSANAGEHHAFSGGGYKLGSDEVESSFVADPNAPRPDAAGETPVIRHLTFWREGFSVEDGELMRYDDPENEQILDEINSGRAPPQILNVLSGQPVELRVAKRLTESYTPSKSSGTFTGTGSRLGAPVPPVRSDNSGAEMPGAFPSGSSTSAGAGTSDAPDVASMSTRFEVDQTLPTTSVQIRLADGTRMVCRMNLTHTVMDLRNFINASRAENLTRPYAIGTTFPNRTLDDNNATIESAGLVNCVVVQRWV